MLICLNFVKNWLPQVFIAQCSKPLFSKHGIYRSGLVDLRFERASLNPVSSSSNYSSPMEISTISSQQVASPASSSRPDPFLKARTKLTTLSSTSTMMTTTNGGDQRVLIKIFEFSLMNEKCKNKI